MGGEGGAFTELLGYLESAIESFPDRRTGKNCTYTIRDAALSGFSVFHIQCPSFLSHQQMMQGSRGNNNARTLFGVHEIPSENCIRDLLDPVAPQYCFSVYRDVHAMLAEKGILEEEYRTIFDTYLLALDGTWFHSSEQIHCDSCSVKEHQDGRTTYYHSAITPVFVRARTNRVIATEPEFIMPQDGQTKQDCELNAGKRWITGVGKKYATMGVTLLGDDLYAKQPFCEQASEVRFHYLFTCKSSSHKYLYEWIESAEVGVDIIQVVQKRWTGKERLYERYRFMNNVPLRDGEDALRVNWCELVIADEAANIRKRYAFITDHLITPNTVVALVEAGRSRWKIENEHNNTLKTKGYNLEHNFGHGKEHLSNLLLTMNLLAFLFHTVLEFFDKRYAVLRKAVGRRQTFFSDIRALTRYWCFESWDDLMRFMLRGMEIPDPGG
jgi:hypothetical protein